MAKYTVMIFHSFPQEGCRLESISISLSLCLPWTGDRPCLCDAPQPSPSITLYLIAFPSHVPLHLKDGKEICQSRLFAACKIPEFLAIWDKSTIQSRTQQRLRVTAVYLCVCVYMCVVPTTHWHLNKGTRMGLLLTSTDWTSCLSPYLTCLSGLWTFCKAHLSFTSFSGPFVPVPTSQVELIILFDPHRNFRTVASASVALCIIS